MFKKLKLATKISISTGLVVLIGISIASSIILNKYSYKQL